MRAPRSQAAAALCTSLLLGATMAPGAEAPEATWRAPPALPLVALDPMDPGNWEIGPLIRGRIRSSNMPLHPSKHPDGWAIDFPHPGEDVGSVHYVTMATGPLTGKSRILMEYRAETAGAYLVPRRFPEKRGTVTMYLQRAGDDWSKDMQMYRWYAVSTTHEPKPGASTVEARLDNDWVSVLGLRSSAYRVEFETALAQAARIGFVLGGGDGLGHGVYATGPFRMIVTSFRIE